METNLTLNQNLPLFINDQSKHGDVIRSLASTLDQAFEKPPVKTLMNSGADKRSIENILAVIVLRYARMLNVSGNLQEGQALEIARMLIEEYPYNSLDDFNVMLGCGVKSRYGQVYRFDVSVVFSWMEKYIDEFYEEKERQIRNDNVNNINDVVPLNIEQRNKIDELLSNYLNQIRNIEIKTVRPMTGDEIRREGKEKPVGIKYKSDPEYAIMHEVRIKWMRHCFDARTGKPNENYVSFEEFQKL